MPLIHSKKPSAFVKNIKSEIHAGKPQKQALAIAYDVQRRSKKAHGGEICEACGGCPCKMAYGGRPGEKSSDILETTKGNLGGGKYSQGALARHGKRNTDIGNKHGDSIHKEMGREATREAKEVAAHKAYEISTQNPKLKGLAHGGEIGSPEHEAAESPEFELSEMAADELMSAIHSKDKEKLVSAMKALIASCMGEDEND